VDATFDEVQHQCQVLTNRYEARDVMLEDLRRMFHMEWKDAPNADWIKPTMSPDAFNACIGAIRLLTATEPQISMPFDQSDDEAKSDSEEIERVAKAMLAGSERVTQRPPHYEVVFSATLFGEVCLGVSKTADLLAMAKRTQIKGTIKRMEMIKKRTPYLFQVWNPETCYPDFDALGLRGMLRRVEVTWGEVLDTWGDAAEKAGAKVANRKDLVKLNDWYDWGQHCVWVDQCSTPIYHKDNELPFLPVIAQIAEGSFMFEKPEQQRLPLLYALYKSGLWQRSNLSLTVLFSLVYALGSVPMWKRKTMEPGKEIDITRKGPIGVIDVSPDEDITPFAEKVIDPSVMAALQTAQALTEQSTLSKVALGSAVPGATFSAISLFASSGRLPLISPKQISGKALAQALETALAWVKFDGSTEKVYTSTGAMDIDPDKIPETLMLNVNLEPDLPQDKMMQANTGNMMIGSGLASKRWVRENIINVGQSAAMDKEVWMEKRVQAELDGALAMVQEKYKAMMAAAQQQQSQPSTTANGAAPSAAGAGEGAQGMTLEMMQAMSESMGADGSLPPGGQVGPGMPMQGPMRPRYEQG
jgi:hypothetical protein